MRLLLDTSYLYDFMDRPGKLLESERRVLAARDTQLYVSAVSIWEMRLKYNARRPSGTRKSRFIPEDVIVALEDQEVTFLPMTTLHAARQLETPLHHNDPFDELLLVQAQEEGLKTPNRRQTTSPPTPLRSPPTNSYRARAENGMWKMSESVLRAGEGSSQ